MDIQKSNLFSLSAPSSDKRYKLEKGLKKGHWFALTSTWCHIVTTVWGGESQSGARCRLNLTTGRLRFIFNLIMSYWPNSSNPASPHRPSAVGSPTRLLSIVLPPFLCYLCRRVTINWSLPPLGNSLTGGCGKRRCPVTSLKYCRERQPETESRRTQITDSLRHGRPGTTQVSPRVTKNVTGKEIM